LKSNLILFFFISNLFANEADLIKLERKKEGLINDYSLRIFEAEQKNLQKRIQFLNKTLECFISSKSRKDITHCKIAERKLLMDLIRD
jgi:hypothetical protein